MTSPASVLNPPSGKGETWDYYTYLFQKDRERFNEELSHRLASLRAISLDLRERISNPRTKSRDKTQKLINRFNSNARRVNLLLKIMEDN